MAETPGERTIRLILLDAGMEDCVKITLKPKDVELADLYAALAAQKVADLREASSFRYYDAGLERPADWLAATESATLLGSSDVKGVCDGAYIIGKHRDQQQTMAPRVAPQLGVDEAGPGSGAGRAAGDQQQGGMGGPRRAPQDNASADSDAAGTAGDGDEQGEKEKPPGLLQRAWVKAVEAVQGFLLLSFALDEKTMGQSLMSWWNSLPWLPRVLFGGSFLVLTGTTPWARLARARVHIWFLWVVATLASGWARFRTCVGCRKADSGAATNPLLKY